MDIVITIAFIVFILLIIEAFQLFYLLFSFIFDKFPQKWSDKIVAFILKYF